MDYSFTKRAEKRLLSFDKPTAKKLFKKIDFLFNQKSPLLNSVKLSGYENIYRFRIGDYRVIFTLYKSTAVVVWIAHRKDVYKEF